jgi:DNA invertase Pin-like site-specific DNA recombinase
MKFVGYYRVSTARQGQSGLGLEAQHAAVAAYVLGRGGDVAAEFTETESGKNNDRPELAKALAEAKARGVKLGWSMPSRKAEQRQAARKGVVVRMAKADDFAANVLPIIREMQSSGMSLRGVANTLNERGVKTARGGKWQAATVRNVLAREVRTKVGFEELMP